MRHEDYHMKVNILKSLILICN